MPRPGADWTGAEDADRDRDWANRPQTQSIPSVNRCMLPSSSLKALEEWVNIQANSWMQRMLG